MVFQSLVEFSSIDDLLEVPGIGRSLIEQNRSNIICSVPSGAAPPPHRGPSRRSHRRLPRHDPQLPLDELQLNSEPRATEEIPQGVTPQDQNIDDGPQDDLTSALQEHFNCAFHPGGPNHPTGEDCDCDRGCHTCCTTNGTLGSDTPHEDPPPDLPLAMQLSPRPPSGGGVLSGSEGGGGGELEDECSEEEDNDMEDDFHVEDMHVDSLAVSLQGDKKQVGFFSIFYHLNKSF